MAFESAVERQPEASPPPPVEGWVRYDDVDPESFPTAYQGHVDMTTSLVPNTWLLAVFLFLCLRRLE